ncbi:hypothetical protein [Lysobacter capsici]|uniref:hypothetical protein n=1 Tax=Lysobacter capsici TaxID=435897 RepID=UPI00287B6269|nr:hypothetical protein [Lysobacter capsici]WND79398.1 hypothetical protein RJ610_19155 [Lysobacter capsici]WND84594.1 hypothetical protein RJ609_19170 [Lysobacter capsici]
MTVQAEQQDGQLRFRLGPVERWIAITAAAVLVTVGGWAARSVSERLDKQGEAITALATQQAVTNSNLTTISAQLANVPGLSRDVAELKVRVDRHDEDLRELRSTKGLK